MSDSRTPETITGGTLDRTPLAEVIRSLYADRATGQLLLTRLGEERTLSFDRGQLASASSNREAQEVGNLLRTFGLADDAILFSAFEKALAEPGRGLAKALRETGAVPSFVADACVRALAEKLLYDTFRWTSGAFSLTAMPNLPDLPVRFDQSNASLILEALRRLPPEAPRSVPRMDPRARPRVATDPIFRYQVATLLREEFDVLTKVDGLRVAADVAADLSVLERLAAIGLLEYRLGPVTDEEKAEAEAGGLVLNVEVGGTPPSPRSAEQLERQIGTIWNTYRRVDWASLYDILGVSPKAAPDEIDRAIQERARLFHPDHAVRPALREGREALEVLFRRVRDASRVFRSPEARRSYDASLERSEQSVAVGPTGPQPEMQREIARKNYLRARQLVEQEDYFPALEMIKQAVEFDTTRPEYWILLARIQRKNRRWIREGTETLRRAVVKMPESVDLWYELSEACAVERNEPERVKALKEILKIDPGNRRAQQALAEIASMKPGRG